MNLNLLRNAIRRIPNGQFTTMIMERPVKLSRAYAANNVVVKRTRSLVRLGVDYENIKKVHEFREAGILPAENTGLPWGRWLEMPYFVEHKGKYYLRVATIPGTKPQIEYFHNGVRRSRAEIENMFIASENKEKIPPIVMTPCIENIIHIG